MVDSNEASTEELAFKKLKLFFSPLLSSVINEDNFPWDSVSQFLESNKDDLLELTNVQVICSFLIKVLEKYTCDNSSVFTAIVDLITVLLLKDSDYENFFKCLKRHHLTIVMFYLRRKYKESVFPYEECVQVINALIIGNHRLIQVLTTYGCNGNIAEDSKFARRLVRTMLEKFMFTICRREFPFRSLRNTSDRLSRPTIRNPVSNFLYRGSPNLTRRMTVFSLPLMETYTSASTISRIFPLTGLRYNPSWQPSNTTFRRLFLVVLGLNAVSLKLQNKARLMNYVRSLEIYFRTISEPYLSVNEMRNLLSGYSIFKSEEALDELCREFQDTIPFCTVNFEPRKLSHLARCQIRHNFSKNENTLPTVLDKMNVPKEIKEFILCKAIEKKMFCNF